MQPFQKNKIPDKYHSFPKDLPVKALYGGRQVTRDLFDRERHFQITRFAPKVLKSFPLPDLNAKSLRALKRVKKIHTVQDVSRVSKKKQWRLILNNKFKSVLVYKHKQLQEWQSLEKYKAFLNVTKVTLKEKTLKKSLMRYLPGMVNLKSLETQVDNWTLSTFLAELNSMPKMLSTLEKFKIVWSMSVIDENKLPLESLIENKNVGKYLTHLDTTGIEEDVFYETFKRCTKYCRNLVFLRTVFAEKSPKSHCKYLKLTPKFEKLEGIQIHLEDLGSFIKHFDLPSSIKDVSINFGESTWGDVYEELFYERVESFMPSLENSLTENKKLESFFEKWKNLNNLVSLWIGAKHNSSEKLFVEAFTKLILSNIPNLTNIEFDIEQNLDENFEYGANKNDYALYKKKSISLTQYFKACQNYSDKLQKMELTLPWKYPLTCLPAESLSFPKLALLKATNNVISDSSVLENLFKIIKKPVSEEPFSQENVIEVILGDIRVKSNEALLELLETLQKCPRNANIQLAVEVEKIGFERFDEVFGEFIEKVKKAPAVKNVALSVKIPGRFFDKGSETLMFLTEVFGKVFFSGLWESKAQMCEEDSEDNEDDDSGGNYGYGDEDEDEDEENFNEDIEDEEDEDDGEK